MSTLMPIRPVGATENSPAFQRWVSGRATDKSRRDGRMFQTNEAFFRPCGTHSGVATKPGVETLGYSLASLRDWFCRLASTTIVLLAVVLPLTAYAEDTNAFSPIVGYQYFESLDEPGTSNTVISRLVSYQYENALDEPGTETTIISPIVSYQYYEWPGDENLVVQRSPAVSYFYNVGSGANVALRGRVVDAQGAPVSGARVSVSVVDVSISSIDTLPNGGYELPPLSSGIYVLSAGKETFVSDRRVVSLSAQTSLQDFLLRPMPALPSMETANSTPPFILPPANDFQGSTLMVFDGAAFVEITEANKPSPDKTTIVLTHGWIPCLEGSDDPTQVGMNDWPLKMARALRARPETTAARVNIVVWDWFNASRGCLPPEGDTPKQGIGLGEDLYEVFGANYSANVHFMGHSLGTLVNAYAADYLQAYQRARHRLAPTPWLEPKRRLHMTLFDDAAISRAIAKEVLASLAVNALFGEGISALGSYGVSVASGWKNPIPHYSAWIDNYPTSVGFAHEAAVNACLQKGFLIELATHNYFDSAVNAHSYGMKWYERTVVNPGGSDLGFGKSYEYGSYHSLPFPAPGDAFAPGAAYHQADEAADELVLDRKSSFLECNFPRWESLQTVPWIAP